MPGDVQQAFANKVITERLAKSVVERLVSTYNNPGTPREVRKSILEKPKATLSWLAKVEKSRGPKPKEDTDSKSLYRIGVASGQGDLYPYQSSAQGRSSIHSRTLPGTADP